MARGVRVIFHLLCSGICAWADKLIYYQFFVHRGRISSPGFINLRFSSDSPETELADEHSITVCNTKLRMVGFLDLSVQ